MAGREQPPAGPAHWRLRRGEEHHREDAHGAPQSVQGPVPLRSPRARCPLCPSGRGARFFTGIRQVLRRILRPPSSGDSLKLKGIRPEVGSSGQFGRCGIGSCQQPRGRKILSLRTILTPATASGSRDLPSPRLKPGRPKDQAVEIVRHTITQLGACRIILPCGAEQSNCLQGAAFRNNLRGPAVRNNRE